MTEDNNNDNVGTIGIVDNVDNFNNVDNVDYRNIYQKAYSIVGDKTPLNTDCGVLCNKICCENEYADDDRGMFLFPGEERMYDDLPDWVVLKPTGIEYSPDKNITLAVCNGKCDRERRPFACRIFPLAGVINKENELKIIMDNRGKSMCPIAFAMQVDEIDISFVKSVTKALKYLLPFREIKAFLQYTDELINEDETINNMFI